MGFTGVNALQRFNEIVTGDKFLREVTLPLNGTIRASNDYLPLVTGDVPTWVEGGISFANAETAFLDFDIPMDYDESQDLCALRFKEVPATDDANTGALSITTAQSIYRAGAAVDATAVAAATTEAATSNAGLLVRENVLDISGRGYKAGDHIRLTISAAVTTELILLGQTLIYSGDLAAFNDADRFRDLG